MNAVPEESPVRDPRLQEVMQAYRKAVEAGQTPDQAALLRQHPELANELTTFFADPSKARSSKPSDPSAELSDAPTVDSAPTAAAAVLTTLRQFGDYELIEELARGGMGVVFKARQLSLNREVALKMILRGELASEAEVQRFHAEAEAAANLDHPNIVPIYEVGEQDGQPYFSMKLVEGGNLSRKVPELNQNPRATAQLVAAVARAVHHAHQRGILHRDLKPGNVLIDSAGQPLVSDFGLAKHVENDEGRTHTGAVVGTPNYMPPEQARGSKSLTTAADIYSLGAILYECLTGRPPFRGVSVMDTLLQVMDQEPPRPRVLNPSVDRDLEAVCLKCLEKDPARRYPSADALADDLQRWSRGEPTRARPVRFWERTLKWARRRPTAAAAIGLALLVFVFGVLGGSATWLWRGAVASRNRAELAEREAVNQRSQAEAARDQADVARRLAESERKTADELRAKTQRLSAALALDNAVNLAEHQESGRALLGLAQGLKELPNSSSDLAEYDHAFRMSLGAWVPQVHPLRHFLNHDFNVMALAFSPDGKTVLTASRDRKAQLWDATTGKPIGATMIHNASIWSATFNPDGKLIATASADRTARIWDGKTGKPRGEPLKHEQSVQAVAFSSDGKLLATGCIDQTARLWDVASGAPVGTPMMHTAPLFSVSFSPDGQKLATTTGEPRVQLWDVATCKPHGERLEHFSSIICVAFSPDSKRVVTGSTDGKAKLWEVATTRPWGPPLVHNAGVEAVAFSPDGKMVLTGSRDNTARLWETNYGAPVGLPMNHTGEVSAAKFSADGNLILTGGRDRTARLWEVPTGRPRGAPMPHRGPVRVIAISPDNKRVLTGDEETTARIWEIGVDPKNSARDLATAGRCAAFSPDGNYLVRGGLDTSAHLWDVATGKPTGLTFPHQAIVTAVAFSPDRKTILTGSADGNARIWDATTGKPHGEPLKHPSAIVSVAYCSDGQFVLTSNNVPINDPVRPRSQGEVRLWEASTGKAQGPPLILNTAVRAAALSPDGKWLVTASDMNDAQIWDVATRQKRGPSLNHEHMVQAVDISPDGKTVLTGSSDNTARLWDAATGQPRGAPLIHEQAVTSVRFSPDGKTVVTGTLTGTARLWDVGTGKPLGPGLPHPFTVTAVSFSPDGKTVAVAAKENTRGDENHMVRLWPMPLPRKGEGAILENWVEVLTGMTLDETGAMHVLNARDWQQRRQQLGEFEDLAR